VFEAGYNHRSIPQSNQQGPSFYDRRKQIAELAVRHLIATCFPHREQAVVGGLMSYGADITDTFRQAGNYVGRILKGEQPADLQVQQPTKFEFVINLKTPKALGLTIPSGLPRTFSSQILLQRLSLRRLRVY
jgi:putative tryptophan/tyrosine transport system substrate-binding protein